MEDIHSKWPHRWITKKAKCNSSSMHGLGVFAIEPISKGENVAVLGGVIVPTSEIKNYWNVMGHVGIQISDDFFIVPTSKEELKETGVFNHSCEPNIGFIDDIQFVAIRDIEVGEELVFDYAFNETLHEEFECKCNSSQCRKVINPQDWKKLEIQEKYLDYFSPYIKRKISK